MDAYQLGSYRLLSGYLLGDRSFEQCGPAVGEFAQGCDGSLRGS